MKTLKDETYFKLKEEYNQQLDQLKAENKTQKETIDGFLTILDRLGKSNIKLRETLTEIKTDILDIRVGISYFWVTDKCDEILQKISEVVND